MSLNKTATLVQKLERAEIAGDAYPQSTSILYQFICLAFFSPPNVIGNLIFNVAARNK
jgi:hypothetical protein